MRAKVLEHLSRSGQVSQSCSVAQPQPVGCTGELGNVQRADNKDPGGFMIKVVKLHDSRPFLAYFLCLCWLLFMILYLKPRFEFCIRF